MKLADIFPKGSHERKVYDFYRHGVENFGDFHGGYLNFGYWENNTENYVRAAELLVEKLAHLLRLESGSTLLDVACGMGPQDIYLAKNFPLQKIDALDLLPEHLEHAKRRIEESGFGNKIELHHGTATALPFGSATFSHVLCIEGLVHFNTRERFFNECYRVLKPGGRIAFSDYVVAKEASNFAELQLLKLVTRLWNIPFDNADSPNLYQVKLEKAGFRNVLIHRVGENVIPGYCQEHAHPECIRELTRIRGFLAGRLGHVIDLVMEWSYRKKLIDYVLVEASKP